MRNIKLTLNLFVFITFVFVFNVCEKEKQKSYNNYRDYQFEEPPDTGNTFFIDPANGSIAGDGSANNPWRTLKEVIDNDLIEFYRHTETYNPDSELEVVNEGAPVKGGDKLILRSGYHEFVNLNNFIFKEWLTIEAQNGHTPILSQFKIMGAFKNIYLKNLTFLKDSYEGEEEYWIAEDINRNSGSCVYLASNDFWGKGSNVKMNGLTVKTTSFTSSWEASDWVEKSASGIGLRSVMDVEIFNCRIENVRHGITVEYHSDSTKVVNNEIINYCADGSRIISNDVFFAYNTITGCLKVDDNHDDAIQSYTRGEDNSPGTGVLSNVIIRGNLIIGIHDKENPLAGSPQGIGCFDGFFDNWIIENNVVIVNHYHGISFYGMRNGRILNNTVIDQVPDDDISPWIMITDHKNETPSENCLISNNIAFSSVSASGINVIEQNNYVFGRSNYDSIYFTFIDPDEDDFHLLSNEFTRRLILDQGQYINGMVSSEFDLEMNKRTGLPDLGAYEFKD